MNTESDSVPALHELDPQKVQDLIEASMKHQDAAEAAGIDLAELFMDGEMSIVLTLLNQAMAAAVDLIWERCTDADTEFGYRYSHDDDLVWYIPYRVNRYALLLANKRHELFNEGKGFDSFMYKFQWLKDAEKLKTKETEAAG